MIALSFKSSGSVRLPRVRLNRADMRELGDVGVDSVKERVSLGVGSNDAGMPPLGGLSVSGDSRQVRRYVAYKRRVTGRSIRDMRLTGQMLDNLQAREAGDNAVSISFSDPKAREKALVNEQRTPWLAFSPGDQEKVFAAAARIFRDAVGRLSAIAGRPRNPLVRRSA